MSYSSKTLLTQTHSSQGVERVDSAIVLMNGISDVSPLLVLSRFLLNKYRSLAN